MRTICWDMAKLRWRARGARDGRFGWGRVCEFSGSLSTIRNESVGTEVPPTTAAALWEGLPGPTLCAQVSMQAGEGITKASALRTRSRR
ncbi:DUF6053 domain-containing protein [Lysobacter enzymogenes]|uniref:DUF6053 domain-containing protein n=1 Tax=Lysobacter enzymogenes TaxID=69 RepID=UPI003CCE4758